MRIVKLDQGLASENICHQEQDHGQRKQRGESHNSKLMIALHVRDFLEQAEPSGDEDEKLDSISIVLENHGLLDTGMAGSVPTLVTRES